MESSSKAVTGGTVPPAEPRRRADDEGQSRHQPGDGPRSLIGISRLVEGVFGDTPGGVRAR
jgi:hypothetical protein